MGRTLTGVAVLTTWIVTFFAVWSTTDPSPVECNDTPTPIEVAAACAAPGRSLLPAIPVATAVALAALVLILTVVRTRRTA